MEYWIIYNLETCHEVYRGGPASAGSAAYQTIPEGCGMLVVPWAVIADGRINIDALRAATSLFVHTSAEAFRMQFLTAGMGQAMSYQRKEAEARAWLLDPAANTPFLEAEAAACDITVEQLVPIVIARADQWQLIGALIEGERMGTKAKIAAATTYQQIIALGRIDWQALAPPIG